MISPILLKISVIFGSPFNISNLLNYARKINVSKFDFAFSFITIIIFSISNPRLMDRELFLLLLQNRGDIILIFQVRYRIYN